MMLGERIVLKRANQIDYLSERDGIASCRQKVEINGSSTLEIELVRKSFKWEYLEAPDLEVLANGRVYFPFGDGWLSKTRNSDAVTIPVTLQEIWIKLSKKFVSAYNSVNAVTSRHTVTLLGNSYDPVYVNGVRITNPYSAGTAQYMFYILLYGTGWAIDTTYDGMWPDGRFDLETDKKSVLGNLEALRDLYGGMLLWDSDNKRVALVDESKYFADSGFAARYGVNQNGIEKKENRDIATKLYVYGNGGLNITAVNGGREYLENYSYTKEVLEDVVVNNDIYSQDALLRWGRQQLEKRHKPRYTYTVDLINYVKTPALMEPKVGELATVYDPEITQTAISTRITGVDQNLLIPEDCSVTLGDVAATFGGKVFEILSTQATVKDMVSGVGKISGSLIRGATPELEKSNQYWSSVVTNMQGDISSISQTTSSISMRVSSVEGNVASLDIRSNRIEARVSNMEGYTSTITQSADQISMVVSNIGRSGVVNAASVVLSINGASSSVRINADHINITGTTTLESYTNGISNGTTVINGGCISTGTLSASKITSGTLDASKVTVKNIDASNITTGSLSASRITTGTLDASKVSVTNINANNITSGTISATRINTNFGSASVIQCGSLSFNGSIEAVGSGAGRVSAKLLYVSGSPATWRTINTTSGTVSVLARG